MKLMDFGTQIPIPATVQTGLVVESLYKSSRISRMLPPCSIRLRLICANVYCQHNKSGDKTSVIGMILRHKKIKINLFCDVKDNNT